MLHISTVQCDQPRVSDTCDLCVGATVSRGGTAVTTRCSGPTPVGACVN